MKSNYDRSKSISRKTTKNYHPRADDPRLLKLCRHVSTVQYSSTVQYLQTCQYGHVRHFTRGETVLRLNTVLRVVSGNSREGASFKLDKQIWRRKKRWYTEDDFSKSTH